MPGLDRLVGATEIAGLIEREADAIERAASLTPPVLAALREHRLFWLLVPEELGGEGLGMVDAMKILEEVTRADGSTGWSLMANAMLTGVASGFLPAEGARELFSGPEPAITAGMVAPVGRARRVPGGYQVSGRFQFGSGSTHASWMGGGMVVEDDQGVPEVGRDGSPVVRIVFVPREQVEFLGNWDVMGLAGTASQDYVIADAFVPEHRTIDPTRPNPVRAEPVFRLGVFGIGVGGHAPVALGLATRALQEVSTAVAKKSRTGYAATVSASEMFRREFARHEAQLQAARLYVHDTHGRAERTAEAGGAPSTEQLARMTQARTWVQEVANDVVRFAHSWAGSAGIRNPSPLGRCHRDMAVAATHALIDPMTLVDAAPAIQAGYVRAGT